MALGSTQPLTEKSTRSISWDKDGRWVRLTTYHHPVPLLPNLGNLTFWNPLGPSGPVTRLLYLTVLRNHISNLMKIHIVGAELFREEGGGQTAMTKLTVAFHNSANAPKTYLNYSCSIGVMQRRSKSSLTAYMRTASLRKHGNPR
jgi:hypothetical protein